MRRISFNRCIKRVHSETRIAGLSNGGLLCAGPDGVRIFNQDGDPLLRAEGQQYRSRSRPQVTVLAAGSWGAHPLAKLIPVTRTGWLEAVSTQQMDIAGEIYTISVGLTECLKSTGPVQEVHRRCYVEVVFLVSNRVVWGMLLREEMNGDLAFAHEILCQLFILLSRLSFDDACCCFPRRHPRIYRC